MEQQKRKEKRRLPYEFTHEELESFGRDLVEALGVRKELEEEKRESSKRLGQQIAAKSEEIENICSMIREGEELRDTEVTVIWNDPKAGKKTVYRRVSEDPLEEISARVEDMSTVEIAEAAQGDFFGEIEPDADATEAETVEETVEAEAETETPDPDKEW